MGKMLVGVSENIVFELDVRIPSAELFWAKASPDKNAADEYLARQITARARSHMLPGRFMLSLM